MDLILPFLIALTLSYALIPLLLKLARKYKFYDYSNERKVHNGAKPYLGGGAIFLSFLLSSLLFLPWDNKIIILLAGGTFYFVLGLLDDKYDLPAKVKLLCELASTSVLVWLGMRHGLFLENPFGGIGANSILAWLSIPFSVLWIVGVANAVNLIDGLDGLASGVMLIAGAALSIAALVNPAVTLSPALVILMGSILGFIRYNLYPSKIIMGDNGALFIGYTIAFISLASYASSDRSIFLSVIPPAMALFVPISDTLMAVFRRRMNGTHIFSADKGHFHHLLLSHGYSQPKVVRIIWGFSAFFGGISLMLSELIYKQVYLALALLVVVVVWAVYSAARFGLFAKSGEEPVGEAAVTTEGKYPKAQ